MIVGICKIDLMLGGHQSLKEKRRIVRKIKDSVFHRFKVPVAEVGHQDLWQRAEFGFAMVGNSQTNLQPLMDTILNYIFGLDAGAVIDKKCEFMDFE